MRVVCPYTALHPATDAALTAYVPHAERVDVSGDDLAYFAALAARWGSDVVVIEHDIVIEERVLGGFDACLQPWCTFPYRIMDADGPFLDRGLGCVRFRAELAELGPLEALVEERWRDWRHLDGGLAAGLEAAGIERHVHGPPVTHRNRHVKP